jgi:hypothetical protein
MQYIISKLKPVESNMLWTDTRGRSEAEQLGSGGHGLLD